MDGPGRIASAERLNVLRPVTLERGVESEELALLTCEIPDLEPVTALRELRLDLFRFALCELPKGGPGTEIQQGLLGGGDPGASEVSVVTSRSRAATSRRTNSTAPANVRSGLRCRGTATTPTP